MWRFGPCYRWTCVELRHVNPREETRHGSEEGREMRAQKAVKNALEEELIAEMYEVIL